MREVFYEQLKEFGVIRSKTTLREDWYLNGELIAVFFEDEEHKHINLIVI